MKQIYLFIMLCLYSCNAGFEELNMNPNSPAQVEPGLLLRKVIYNLGDEMSYEAYVAGHLLAQYYTQIDFNLFDRHRLTDPQFGGNPWPVLYSNLRDNEQILNRSQSHPQYAVYAIPAMVLKAYMAATITDIYGDVPYTKALMGQSGLTRPAYDSQEEIYLGDQGVLALLDRAISLSEELMHSSGDMEGDILYGGDLSLWQKMAWSLKIKYLLRVSGRIDVKHDLAAAYLGAMYIDDNSENASFDFTDTPPNNFRMANLREGDFKLFILSETYESLLKTYNDPRLERFFRPAASSPQPEYNGLRNGPDASVTSISVNDYSLPGPIFRENTSALDASFITAWETNFLLAEAAQRQLIDAPAEALYERAVELAFEYWQTELPDNYLGNGPAAFDSEHALEQILAQKYIANLLNGYESWIEYRRTGFPELLPVTASLNNGIIPVKMPYPADEQTLNTANYIEATMGSGNSVNEKVSWDID